MAVAAAPLDFQVRSDLVSCAVRSEYGVRILDPEGVHLAGHMLASMLRRACADPRRVRTAARIRSVVLVDAGGMLTSLDFGTEEVCVRAGACDRPRAVIRARLDVLVDAALWRRGIRHALAGRLRVRGSPTTLARLLRVLAFSPAN